MIPDDDSSLKRTFGVTGTPAAVMIDALGIVASDVARGATAVRALGTDRFSKRYRWPVSAAERGSRYRL